jgi:23S rRNA pseudouridine1911/1915/1917 synthase
MQTRIQALESWYQKRIDHALHDYLDDMSRTHITQLIKSGHILVNENIVKAGYIIKKDDVISIDIPKPKELDLTPVSIPLDIVFEDAHILVINKQKGLVVHPSLTYHEPTLVHGLLYYLKDLSSINGVLRPGIVHRIDKDTTGLLIVAKTDIAHQKLATMLEAHTIIRTYEAIVEGQLKEDHYIIDANIQRHPVKRQEMTVMHEGKHAVTHVDVISRYEHHTHVQCVLETGRTHQIRVHLKFIGHPIVFDPVYGIKKEADGQLLHAFKLSFEHPITGEALNFIAPRPERFDAYLRTLNRVEVL